VVSIVVWSRVLATAVLEVCTVGDSAFTVTVSDTLETFITGLIRTASPIVAMTFSCTMVAKPASLKVTV